MQDHPSSTDRPAPPRLADALLTWYCTSAYREEIQGDLLELFYKRAHREGLRIARVRYWIDVLRFIRPYVLRRQKPTYQQARGPIMLTNYFKITLRNLLKHKLYTFINVSGLAVGMACCMMIYLFVQHEWSYDTFHEHGDDIYRVVIQETLPDGSLDYRIIMPPNLGVAMQEAYPSIDRTVQLVSGNATFLHQNEPFQERVFEADSTLFEVFTFPLLSGHPQTALSDPNAMVISEDIAEKYFGGLAYEDILGRYLSIDTGPEIRDFAISGVMQNIPSNSSLQMDIIISFENYAEFPLGGNDWGGRASMYVLLADGGHPDELERALPPFTTLQFEDRIQARRDGGYLAEGAETFQLKLQPLRELHLDPEVGVSYEGPTHNPVYSYILSGIGLLVLLIACINFMTLSVGRSTSRAREVGMRKVMGAVRGQLMGQFWGEALLLSFLALILSIGLAALGLPLFNTLTGATLALEGLLQGFAPFVLVGLVAVAGLVAGSYPAVVLARFQPASVLKGDVKGGRTNLFTRTLVGIQYALSIALMVCAGIMGQQLEFLRSTDLGYNDDQVVAIRAGRGSASERVEQYRTALEGYDQIKYVVATGQSFARGTDRRSWGEADGTPRSSYVYGVDYDFLDLMEMEIVAGRNFSRDFTTDPTGGVLVNEALVEAFGLEDPVGKPLEGFMDGFYEEPAVILGVVKNFHFQSLHEEVEPAILTMHPDYFTAYALVKIAPENIPATLTLLEETWGAIAPNTPFSYSFVDEDIQSQYQTEERWGQIMGYATLLALLIACMGLFGLAALMVSKRTKEIGIRKVLGASVPKIVWLLSLEFVKIVGVATLIAWPFAYVGMDTWLADFAYRIDIGIGVFVLAGLAAVTIALLAVSYQSVRAAFANPVESLRYE